MRLSLFRRERLQRVARLVLKKDVLFFAAGFVFDVVATREGVDRVILGPAVRVTRARRVFVLLVVCALWVTRVSAHPVPFSFLDLRIQPPVIDATLVIHIFDLGHDLDVAPAERLLDPAFARARAGDIAALVARRLSIRANGRVVNAVWTDLEVLTDRQSVLHAKWLAVRVRSWLPAACRRARCRA